MSQVPIDRKNGSSAKTPKEAILAMMRSMASKMGSLSLRSKTCNLERISLSLESFGKCQGIHEYPPQMHAQAAGIKSITLSKQSTMSDLPANACLSKLRQYLQCLAIELSRCLRSALAGMIDLDVSTVWFCSMRDRSRLESVSGSPAGHWKADPDKITLKLIPIAQGNCAQPVGGLVAESFPCLLITATPSRNRRRLSATAFLELSRSAPFANPLSSQARLKSANRAQTRVA